ncbi:MAG: DUF3038 domain-containing protein [Symploca sp. SIO3C6]|uniref:DUF3038 domain-containing protein n=1 Tax=Symploca sp. SIO1C4 TaxID=2607765 RepID=A0A6B3NEU0_9CYAN|nr:DUF3038 domain-containing protein [Symploca sp. SIO3C6]NER30137.1 DUF3038 domain-containing protein [Symploca sp. SIO1C4]NET07444.1 DUF3038 domain-containing protein [Symploca sp. SIO2B6]NET49359.1 DUF3038 domain-containing protein [Merismopedia sp. SIO2A8]
MNLAVSLMPTNTPTVSSKPMILDNLPDPPVSNRLCPPRTRQQIDLILLAIEALELGGSEAMLYAAKELELQDIITNRVVLWRLRCTNPWRRSYTRRPLQLEEAKAMVVITSHLARRMTVLIRQLLMAYQQLNDKQLPLEQHLRLSEYLERFRTHFRSRMNPRRAKVTAYSSDEKLNELALSLLNQLLFCTGTSGMQRFWVSLFDGEVA